MQTPPNYAQYPRAGGPGGGGMGYRGPGVYFDYISTAFNMIKNNMGVYVVGVLILLVITYAIQIPFSLINNILMSGSVTGPRANGTIPAFNLAMLPVMMLLNLIPTTVMYVLGTGLMLCAVEEADTGRTSINTMFSAFRNFLPVAATCLLYVLAVYIGAIFCLVPGFFLAGALGLAPIISAAEGIGPIPALQRSFDLIKGNAWGFAAFLLVAYIVSCLGLIACCIGVLFTFPTIYIGIALHYRDFRGPIDSGFQAPVSPYQPTYEAVAETPVAPVAPVEPVAPVAPVEPVTPTEPVSEEPKPEEPKPDEPTP